MSVFQSARCSGNTELFNISEFPLCECLQLTLLGLDVSPTELMGSTKKGQYMMGVLLLYFSLVVTISIVMKVTGKNILVG